MELFLALLMLVIIITGVCIFVAILFPVMSFVSDWVEDKLKKFKH